MKRLVTVGLALASIALLGVIIPWRAGAQDIGVGVTEVGWWSSNPIAVAQPEGGFQVAAGPDGATQSLAAIRLSISATSVDSLPVHLVESSSVGADFGILRLCTTRETWTKANPGTMDKAPKPDCSVSANLTRTIDGSWLGDAAALAPQGGQVSVMVVPVYQPPAPVGPGMVVTISGGQFTATGSSVTSTTGTTTDSSYDSGSGSGGSSVDYYGSTGGGSFGIPDSTITPSFGSVAPPAEQVAVPSRTTTEGFALTPVKSDGGPPPPWIRLVILIPLSGGFGVGISRLRRAIGEGLLPFG